MVQYQYQCRYLQSPADLTRKSSEVITTTFEFTAPGITQSYETKFHHPLPTAQIVKNDDVLYCALVGVVTAPVVAPALAPAVVPALAPITIAAAHRLAVVF
ncbi:hypothetical protein EVAR_40487_1 [Eumeta japonica]|uniref:Uncharacterized protein n=1 Tax=Eumeta variegata TaxID=151549 RepID=A0A4C1XUR2_EUMVA|nr:hypothetical protein EVAR_40487_1 [Eumeta japonica]